MFIIFFVLFSAVFCDDCPPCQCQIYYFDNTVHCTDTTTNYVPLHRIPKINFTQNVVWNDMKIEDQPLNILPENAFLDAELENLIYIKIVKCNVSEINEHAFRNVTDLYHLELTHNTFTKLDDNIFQHTTSITNLILYNNKLEYINNKIFSNLHRLQKLDLSHNFLHTFHENALLNNAQINLLFLKNNNLSQLNVKVISKIKSLQQLTISENPWVCDCFIQDLFNYIYKKFMKNKSNYAKQRSETTCYAPEEVKGYSWRNLDNKNFSCWLRVKPLKEKYSAVLGKSVNISCVIESSKLPKVIWKFNNKMLNTTSKKYNVRRIKLTPVNFLYELEINDFTKEDRGQYKCILFNLLPAEAEMKLVLEKKPINMFTIILIVGSTIFGLFALLLFVKCIVRCTILSNREEHPRFEENNKWDDNISLRSEKPTKL